MRDQAQRLVSETSQPAAHTPLLPHTGRELGVADRRPAASAQRALSAMVSNSPRTLQQKAVADRINSSRRVSASAPIQRRGAVAPPASSAGLVNEYNNLLNSAEFDALDAKVTTNQNITLVDSSLLPGTPTDYDSGAHTIRVPLMAAGVARPLTEVREDILWEMHNASVKGAHVRTNNKFAVAAPGPGSSTEEKKIYPYQLAALALSMEWDEWMNVIEHHIKTQQINASVPMAAALGAGPHIGTMFAASFAVADAGWFLFSNYLTDQLASGHTAFYDPNAGVATWVGKGMLKIVEAGSKAALTITTKQVRDYTSGATKTVKKSSTNPFKSNALITESSRGN